MKVGVLFSGGKDSALAAWIAKSEGYELSCMITVESKNENSFMFHTPSIKRVKEQAKLMNLPLIVVRSEGQKEIELGDLEYAISKAKKKWDIDGIVTGAVESIYQSTRIQKICRKFKLECFNPLWQKDQFDILRDLIKNKFEVIIVGVFAYPLDNGFLGKKINDKFLQKMIELNEKYKISPAGEGGEFESFVLRCPLFENKIRIKGYEDFGEANSWRRELKI